MAEPRWPNPLDDDLLAILKSRFDEQKAILQQVARNTYTSTPKVKIGTLFLIIGAKGIFDPISPNTLRVLKAIIQNNSGPVAGGNQVVIRENAVAVTAGSAPNGITLAPASATGNGTGGTLLMGAVDLSQVYWTTGSNGNTLNVYYEVPES